MKSIDWYEGLCPADEYDDVLKGKKLILPETNGPMYCYIEVDTTAAYIGFSELSNAKPHIINAQGKAELLSDAVNLKTARFSRSRNYVFACDIEGRVMRGDYTYVPITGVSPVYPSLTDAAHEIETETRIELNPIKLIQNLKSGRHALMPIEHSAAKTRFTLLPTPETPILSCFTRGRPGRMIVIYYAGTPIKQQERAAERETQLAILEREFWDDLTTCYAQPWLGERGRKRFEDLIKERGSSIKEYLELAIDYGSFFGST